MKTGLSCFLMVLFFIAGFMPVAAADQDKQQSAVPADIPRGVIDPELLSTAYRGDERLRFDVSYTGGLKLGELHIAVTRLDERPDSYQIHARVTTDDGLFSALYPIEDVHVTKVSGPQRLPYYYEVWQQEGFSYEAHRVTKYDQRRGRIAYWHNEKPAEIFQVGSHIQNEFSSFFASRIMDLTPGRPFVVSTFADYRRNEVVVMVRDREQVAESLFDTVDTVVVEPIMKFSGLYDKRGDTVIWYTDDRCRVPVLVNSKLLIGSLTARLVAYHNPACPDYHARVAKKYQDEYPDYQPETK
ncbi:DUF3108 domain-containing protein [Desulfofustis glycolicus]|uniref:DUF3108 domain-containing protein n=1 Tax=Desulfofustis glycolicus DSM 9705 TaxID=1121409 RepID=A0A1M5Y8N4_9BACT|nr:DUF3108 domain-containing protein [Desulfofustis glycolicus]MCB2218385.1 DUF3108 domain-containing protein [Desulfobulbaceae bacterium]SHI08316.1 Protein of unknown function [Desulfofustis glycolicus DSM 9705]